MLLKEVTHVNLHENGNVHDSLWEIDGIKITTIKYVINMKHS